MRTSVSKKTDFLIVGANPGKSKAQAADEKGVPTISWVTLNALGYFEKREHKYRLGFPEDLFSQLLIRMAFIIEEIYVAAWHGNRHADRAAKRASAGFERLLRSAYGRPVGGSIEADGGAT